MQYVHVGLVEAVDEGLGHHLAGRPHGLDAAIPQRDQLVAVAGGGGEIVDDDEHRLALGGDLVDGLHHLGLVADVEGAGRFIQQDDVRILGQHHGEPHPLGLAAGERAGALLQNVAELHPLAGPAHHVRILLAPLIEPALMGMAAVLHQLLDLDAGGHQRALGQVGELAGQRFLAVACQRLALEQDLAGLLLLLACQQFEQGGLAAAVGADDPYQLALGNGEGDVVEDGLVLIAKLQVIDGERHQAALGLS